VLKESIAARYSAALFSLAQERGEVPKTAEQLDVLVNALHSDPGLASFFASPVVDREVKQDVMRRTLQGKVSELVLNFVLLLVRKRRETLLEVVARQLHELHDREAGRQVAAIATAKPLTKRELDALAKRLSAVHGRTIIPQHTTAPELLGGVVVKVGDRYTDGSVSGKLEELRRQLLAVEDTRAPLSPNGKA
jgi:F-type H+-transporting ATPase subunit delta